MTTELAMGAIGTINLNECETDISTYITNINNTNGYTITASYNTHNPISDALYMFKPDNDSKPRMFYQAETYGRQYRTIRFGRSKETSIYLMPEFSDVRIIRDKEGSSIGVEIDLLMALNKKLFVCQMTLLIWNRVLLFVYLKKCLLMAVILKNSM